MTYLQKLFKLVQQKPQNFPKGSIGITHIYHDLTCKREKTGINLDCDCNPDIRIEIVEKS